jgi:GMP synthase-like glutamine amidotransferase
VSDDPHRVLILDLAVDPEVYRPTAHWRALLGPTPSHSVALLRGGVVPPLGGFSHLIISGSEASVLEPQPWFDPAEETIRAAVARAMPLLGSCFGHQLVVRALHGPAHLRRAERPELGWFPVTIAAPEADAQADALVRPGAPVWMFCCHFDEVCDLEPGYRVWAHTDGCAVHAYRWGDAPVWGVQGHPEIPPDEGAALLAAFARQRPEVADAVARALAAPHRDDGDGAVLTRRFLEQA